MLKSLTVINFALIEQTEVEFSEGLNILTGETGAGKSILIDALSTVLGNRASIDFIRTGCDFFRVEAVFDIPEGSPISILLEEQNIPLEDDNRVIVSRKLTRNGKNSILINGCNTTLNVLRQIGEKLVDVHGQHENQALLRPDSYLSLLDNFANSIKDKLSQYQQVYHEWAKLNKELSVTEDRSRERAQRVDMLTWQIQEIASASLKVTEEEEMEQEIQILSNAEKIVTAAGRAYALFSQGAKGLSGILTSLAEVKHELEIVTRYDQRLEPQLTIVADSLYQLEECSADLRDYCEDIDFNPKRLATLQDRLDIIYKLKKKYGTTIAEILEYYEQAQAELSDITNFDQRVAELTKQQVQLEQKLKTIAGELDIMRRQAAKELAEQVTQHLIHLGMPKALLLVDVTRAEQFTPSGCNEAVLLFTANPGEEAKPLYKIASGGELSRIALAIKTVCVHRDSVGTMIFDEIDAGIGGQTAQMVAERIAMVASQKQVLCITHLPQIACMADSHIYIEKQVLDNRTNTVVKILDQQKRLIELTRMITGSEITQLAVDNAAQMCESASQKKEKWKNKA